MKAKNLARVAALYGQVERVRLAELQEAAEAVAAADRLRAAGEAACEESRAEGRVALAKGEITEWRLAGSTCEVAEVTVAQATALRAEREQTRVSFADLHRASRMRAEQVARVVDTIREVESVIEGRREQAATDDRYAARLCWTRMKTS